MRLIVPFPPGGPNDVFARLIGQWLHERLGQPIIIDNRPGAGGNIGTEVVVKAAPDGYTLLLINSNHTVNATLYDKLNYNFIRDIAPVAAIIQLPLVLVLNPLLPRRPFWNSQPMRRPILANSTTRRSAMAAHLTWPANCSR